MNQQLPSGEWNGFYMEAHRPERSWMNFYLECHEGAIKAEGTDYVGPWHAEGMLDVATRVCQWVKQYVGQHQVVYRGQHQDGVITGEWHIGPISGPFVIWPKSMQHLTELYLRKELELPNGKLSDSR